MTTDDISDGTWTFYDSFAAFPLNRLHESRDRTNVVGEFMVSFDSPEGGTYGEFAIRFHDHSDRWSQAPRLAARLEVFGDAWKALAMSGLVEALSALDGDVQDQDAVRRVLLDLGYEDKTAQLRGDHPSHCPTCHGKGVLDDVAPSALVPTP